MKIEHAIQDEKIKITISGWRNKLKVKNNINNLIVTMYFFLSGSLVAGVHTL